MLNKGIWVKVVLLEEFVKEISERRKNCEQYKEDEKMNVLLVVIFIAVLIIAVISVLIVRKNKRAVSTINLTINSRVGTCRATGNKDAFNLDFNGTAISFQVKDGIITGYKTDGSSSYKSYPVERRNS